MKIKFLTLLISWLVLGNLTAQSTPNILFIHVDDLGYHDLSYTGSKIYQTPNIDGLAATSITFEQGYSSYPRCTPSRYGLITGTYPVNEDHGTVSAIPDEENFVYWLNEAGYNTGFIGKWHLGSGPNEPKGFGFDYSFAAGGTGGTGSRFYPFNVEKNPKEGGVPDVEAAGKKGDYLSDLLTTATINFMKGNGTEKPFFAMLSFYSVHTPLEAKPEDEKRNKAEINAFDFGDTPEYIPEGAGRRKMRQDDAAYAGMVENMDENVGRLLKALEEMGISKNTIIIFSSDHGALSNGGSKWKRQLASTNHPLRAGKGWLYEGGIRVPLIIHWADQIRPRAEKESIVLGMDLMPTLLDLALGQKMEGIDGKSFKAVIEGKEIWEDRTVFWHSRKARPHSTGDPKTSAIRSGDYKLLHFFDEDKVELYNLKTDIGESQDLAKAEPEKAKALLAQLNEWKKEYLVPEKLNRKKVGKGNKQKKVKKK